MISTASRISSFVVVGVLAAIGVGAAVFAFGHWTLEDMHVYLEAARRLRAGDDLYSTINPLAAYQYAPWFAALWIPLTFVPEVLVSVIWSAALVIASVLAVRPLLRTGTKSAATLALLLLPILLFSSARSGNVQPLLIAALVMGLERRWGPVAIAVAASLKAFPLALALVYLGRREWGRFAAASVVTIMLVAPMLLFDLSRYTVDGPRAGTLFDASPILWAALVVVLAVLAIALAWRRSSHTWLVAAATVVVGLPRTLTYDMTFLLAAVPDSQTVTGRDQGQRTSSAANDRTPGYAAPD